MTTDAHRVALRGHWIFTVLRLACHLVVISAIVESPALLHTDNTHRASPSRTRDWFGNTCYAQVENAEAPLNEPPQLSARLLSSVTVSRAAPSSVSKPGSACESAALFKRLYHRPGEPTGWIESGCAPGRTSKIYEDATLDQINYYRSMAGLPAVTFDESYSAGDQEAAIIMRANQTLTHYPDASFLCYTTSGAEAAQVSNLSGRPGPSAIDDYIADIGPSNFFVGHRRWLLYPPQQVMGTGSVGTGSPLEPSTSYPANATWVIGIWGRRPSTPEWVAWPPDGYVPLQVVPQRWSFSYPNADFTQATVKVKTGSIEFDPQIEPIVDDYGDNTIVWLMGTWTTEELPVTVTVSITDVMIDNAPRAFRYDVTMIDDADPTRFDGVGDCNGDGAVQINELIVLVNVVLGDAPPSDCPDGIPQGRATDVALIIHAVSNSLRACPMS